MTPATPLIGMVCSAARSGSTLLDLLLGGHSRAASLGEFSFLGKALSLKQDCTCGARIDNCDEWRRVLDQVQQDRGIDLRERPYALQQWDAKASTVIDHQHQTRLRNLQRLLGSATSDLRYATTPPLFPLLPNLRRGCRNALYLYGVIARAWQVDVLLDSSKNVHKALALYEQAPTQIRILYLTRDGRGVFHSRRSSGFSRQESARGWVNYNRRAQRLLPRHVAPEHLIHIRYEDLMADPESNTRRLASLLGLEFEPDMLRINPQQAHLVNGNDMRFRGEQTLTLDERWRREGDETELAWFLANDGGLNAALGYH